MTTEKRIETTPDRLRGHLRHFARKYPGAWKQFDLFRFDRGRDLPYWPEWCWCPLAGAYAIVSGGKSNRVPLPLMADVGTLGALGAWRMTQGIYRFDSDLFSALWSTPLGKIPVGILYRLPEWCVYVEAPAGYKIDQHDLLGWFTHLEYDIQAKRPELRFLFDFGKVLSPFILHLTSAILAECIEKALAESQWQAKKHGYSRVVGKNGTTAEDLKDLLTSSLAPVVSVVLYLCTVAADVVDLKSKRERPENPVPKKTKKGLRIFPANSETTWLVGYRIGASLRLASRNSEESKGERADTTERASPRPHIRRAHWATYWTGPKDQPQKPVLRWLPPVPVGIGKIVPAIRKVERCYNHHTANK